MRLSPIRRSRQYQSKVELGGAAKGMARQSRLFLEKRDKSKNNEADTHAITAPNAVNLERGIPGNDGWRLRRIGRTVKAIKSSLVRLRVSRIKGFG